MNVDDLPCGNTFSFLNIGALAMQNARGYPGHPSVFFRKDAGSTGDLPAAGGDISNDPISVCN